jgi:hypothetical protein
VGLLALGAGRRIGVGGLAGAGVGGLAGAGGGTPSTWMF